MSTPEELTSNDVELLKQLGEAYAGIRREVAKTIVGQDEVIEQLLIAIFAQGHCLLEGVPGLAKTLIINTLAQTLDFDFSRIQFTPDLMPSDITGTEVIQEDKRSGERVFKFLEGPVFANVVLADEINRTPPKTQAAMLEAMQEKQVSAGGQRRPLPKPFFVLATQNPIEQEGTYPLPEAQQDRFMFKIFVDYPSYDEEYRVAESTTGTSRQEIHSQLGADEVIAMQNLVRRVPVSPHVIHYTLKLVRATRITTPEAADFCKEWLSWGCGPRAVQNLLLAAKTRAALHGRNFASTDDVNAVLKPVLRHRILTNFNAEAEGISTDVVVEKLMELIDPNDVDRSAPELGQALA